MSFLSFLQKTYLRKILELLSGTSNLHLNSTSKHFQESHYARQIQCTKYHDATMVFFENPRKLHINYCIVYAFETHNLSLYRSRPSLVFCVYPCLRMGHWDLYSTMKFMQNKLLTLYEIYTNSEPAVTLC